MKTELLYGIHPVAEALVAGKRDVFEIYISKEKHSKRLDNIETHAAALNIKLHKVNMARIEAMVRDRKHQGVCATVSPYPYTAFSDMLACETDSKNSRFFLLLDNILDPHNFGAIIRTALCVGVDGIIITKDRSVPPTPAVSKTSAGALEHARVAMVTNLAGTITTLKKNGVWIFGMDMAAEKTIYSTDLSGNIAVVLGGEEKGIRPLSKKHCDVLISIPQVSKIDSLNASVAGSIVMYEAFRQKHHKNKGQV